MLCGFPRVDATRRRTICCGCLCEDVCVGHDSRGEVPRGALDSEDGFEHYCGVFGGVRGKGVGVVVAVNLSLYPPTSKPRERCIPFHPPREDICQPSIRNPSPIVSYRSVSQ